jgi:hypothetical protein
MNDNNLEPKNNTNTSLFEDITTNSINKNKIKIRTLVIAFTIFGLVGAGLFFVFKDNSGSGGFLSGNQKKSDNLSYEQKKQADKERENNYGIDIIKNPETVRLMSDYDFTGRTCKDYLDTYTHPITGKEAYKLKAKMQKIYDDELASPHYRTAYDLRDKKDFRDAEIAVGDYSYMGFIPVLQKNQDIMQKLAKETLGDKYDPNEITHNADLQRVTFEFLKSSANVSESDKAKVEVPNAINGDDLGLQFVLGKLPLSTTYLYYSNLNDIDVFVNQGVKFNTIFDKPDSFNENLLNGIGYNMRLDFTPKNKNSKHFSGYGTDQYLWIKSNNNLGSEVLSLIGKDIQKKALSKKDTIYFDYFTPNPLTNDHDLFDLFNYSQLDRYELNSKFTTSEIETTRNLKVGPGRTLYPYRFGHLKNRYFITDPNYYFKYAEKFKNSIDNDQINSTIPCDETYFAYNNFLEVGTMLTKTPMDQKLGLGDNPMPRKIEELTYRLKFEKSIAYIEK